MLSSLSNSYYASVVVLLWTAEEQCEPRDRSLIRDPAHDSRPCRGETFPSDSTREVRSSFVTYLRTERPTYWHSRTNSMAIYDGLTPEYLAHVEPLDALFVAETWPEMNGGFIRHLPGGPRQILASVDPLSYLRTLRRMT